MSISEQNTINITRRSFVVDLSVSALALSIWGDTSDDETFVSANDARRKKVLGQFFTEENCWLQPQVAQFIKDSGCTIAYDPFAGTGCLFTPVTNTIAEVTKVVGLDIDAALGWRVNDSLLNIPFVQDAIIITNPPYISNYSAARKKLDGELRKYFEATPYDDVYLLALDRMLSAQQYVVAIIPETFINSAYRQKSLLSSLTILEENPFRDTDTPVLVACFDSIPKAYKNIKVYKGEQPVCSLADVENCRMMPANNLPMKFNDINGWLAVRCVDTTNPENMIHFDFKEKIKYNWGKGIKNSSRLLTLISVEVPVNKRDEFIACCNELLQDLRKRSHDLVLSPFKGNMKNGVRRRRLDFQTCRAIIELAHVKTVQANNMYTQMIMQLS